jgi:hypothetical protein
VHHRRLVRKHLRPRLGSRGRWCLLWQYRYKSKKAHFINCPFLFYFFCHRHHLYSTKSPPSPTAGRSTLCARIGSTHSTARNSVWWTICQFTKRLSHHVYCHRHTDRTSSEPACHNTNTRLPRQALSSITPTPAAW